MPARSQVITRIDSAITYNYAGTAKSFGGTSYLLDPDGFRVRKVAGTDTLFYLRGIDGAVLAEYGLNGALAVKYIYAGGQIAAHVSGGATSYYIADHLGSTRRVVSISDTSTYDYWPFGAVYDQGGPGSRYQFTGLERDSESALIHTPFRLYDPYAGRFLQGDPLFALSPERTPYHYARNDPLGYVDVTGLVERPVPSVTYSDKAGNYYSEAWVTYDTRGSSDNSRQSEYLKKYDKDGNGTPDHLERRGGGGNVLGSPAKVLISIGESTQEIAASVRKAVYEWSYNEAIEIRTAQARRVLEIIADPTLSDATKEYLLRLELDPASVLPVSGSVGILRGPISNLSAVHHIVAQNAKKAAGAKAILSEFGIDVQSAANRVLLPTSKLSKVPGMLHTTLHTNVYYREVEALLRQAISQRDVFDILEAIRIALQQGTFPR